MLAIQQGIQPQNIILNGNGKQNWEIEMAVKHDCLINVDSTFDLNNIIKISNKLNKKVRVLVRLNPDIDAVRRFAISYSIGGSFLLMLVQIFIEALSYYLLLYDFSIIIGLLFLVW